MSRVEFFIFEKISLGPQHIQEDVIRPLIIILLMSDNIFVYRKTAKEYRIITSLTTKQNYPAVISITSRPMKMRTKTKAKWTAL